MDAAWNLLWDKDRAVDGCKALCLVTIGVVLNMATTRKRHVVDFNHTLATVFSTSRLWAEVLVRTEKMLTRLRASKDLMYSLGVAAGETLVAAVAQPIIASQLATTFRAKA